MRMALMIVSYSLLVGSLLPKDVVAYYTPELSLPKEETSRCVIGDGYCDSRIQRLQTQMTSILNEQRFRVARGSVRADSTLIATNMLKLEEDQSLKDQAQKYAEDCIQVHGTPEKCQLPGETETKGDVSIFIQRYNVGEMERNNLKVEQRVAMAINQIAGYPTQDTFQFVNSFDPKKVEHEKFHDFAKLIHARVWKVGCGTADHFHTEEDFNEIIACFYGPPKLKAGEQLYRIGSEPCKECPTGTQCETQGEYQGTLCKVIDENSLTPDIQPARIPLNSDPNDRVVPIIRVPRDHDTEDAESGILIWQCDLYTYSKECRLERSCASRWKVNTTGGFKYVEVSGTCVTASIFLQEIFIKGKSCFMFRYRKEGSQIDTTVLGFASQVNAPNVPSTSVGESEEGDEWNDMFVDIPWGGTTVQVGVIVRSRSDSDEKQKITVRDFNIFTGPCSEN